MLTGLPLHALTKLCKLQGLLFRSSRIRDRQWIAKPLSDRLKSLPNTTRRLGGLVLRPSTGQTNALLCCNIGVGLGVMLFKSTREGSYDC